MARQRLVNVDVPRIDTEPFAELCDQPQLDLVLRRPLPPRQRGRCRLRRGGAALPRDYRPPHPDDRQRTGEIVRTAGTTLQFAARRLRDTSWPDEHDVGDLELVALGHGLADGPGHLLDVDAQRTFDLV